MKGVIFVELLKMAEKDFGEDAVDMVLDKIDLDNDGSFTTVGNYPCSELVKLVMAFSEHSGTSPEALQRKFGHWLMAHFAEHHADFFAGKADSFAMLEAVDGEIHVEVKKLYPDADLPVFSTQRVTPDHMEMIYSSQRPLVEFCYGMIEACLDQFDETADIQLCPVTNQENATKFDIRLTKQGRKSHERRN